MKEILKHNDRSFLDDLKLASEVMVFCETTGTYFKIKKTDVMRRAATMRIYYSMTDRLFARKRLSMLIR